MVEKRKPQKSPGAACLEHDPSDDIFLPESLYRDAVYFCELAFQAELEENLYLQERFIRSALYAAFAFFEAYVNQVAFTHAKAHAAQLGQIERDILEEKETTLDERGNIIRKDKFYRMETRFCFLAFFLSGKDFDRNTSLWSNFLKAKEIRDKWTHPKPPFDTWSLKAEDTKFAIHTLRQMFVTLSEMMEIEPPLWIADNGQMATRLKDKIDSTDCSKDKS